MMFNTCMDLKRAAAKAELDVHHGTGTNKQEANIAIRMCHGAEKMLLTLIHFLAQSAHTLYVAHGANVDLTRSASSVMEALSSPHQLRRFMKHHRGMQNDIADEERLHMQHDVNEIEHSKSLQDLVSARVNARFKATATLHAACAANRYAKSGCEIFWGARDDWSETDWTVYCNWHFDECELVRERISS